MSALALNLILDNEPDASLDDLLAVFDEMDAREAQSEAERLRALRAPAVLWADLSDADPHWVQHECVSDDSGVCGACRAYVAKGGVL